MNNGRFRILLRRRQNQSEYPPGSGTTVNVVVNCAPLTGWAEYIPGTVDNITPFVVSDTESITPVDGWYDFTDFIEPDGINKLSFTWDKVNSGDSSNSTTNADGSNYDKGISSDLTFFDAGYRFIYNWLLSTECSILNAIEVKIIDLIARGNNPDPAGNYRIFEIKSDNIEYAPVDEPCQFHIKLREQDNVWHCIHKNFIWDNWQHWFEDSNVKAHPCFLTCIEPRPRLVQSARMALMLFLHSFPTTVIIDWITDAPTITEEARKVLNANRFVDAPLVRTYIENIAGKCNLQMDTVFDVGQVFENLCLYYPQAGFMHESDDDAAASPSLAYTFDNRWLVTIAELLDKLKVVLCAEWYVTPNSTIVFKFKKDLINLAPIYDFTLAGAEPVYGIRYTFNGDKKPAYGKYEYTDDGSDLASQEMSTLYSDTVDYDGPANNPMLEGDRTKNFEFAPTGFVRDGRSKDYMELLLKDGKFGALILIGIFFVIAAFLIPGVFTTPVGIVLLAVAWAWVGDLRLKMTALNNEFVNGPTYTGAVRLTSEQTLTPRLLLWDGLSEQRAKVVQRVGLPVPNPYYNPNLTAYNVKNKIQEDNPSAIVYNYPLYFDGDFYGNLFPDYHDVIDNPLKSLETHQDVKWSVDLCDTMLNLFGVFENQYAQIGKIVKLEHRDGYDVYVRIGNISVDYDAEQINLKGTVIRRKNDSVDDPNNPGNIPVVTPEESSGAIIEPGDICLKWVNNGSEDANVAYRDCNGIHQMGVIISPEETFCAFEIYSYAGGNLVATNACDEESGSGSSSAAGTCQKWINFDSADVLNVSYIDCDGNPVGPVTVSSLEFICAREITDMGSCGKLVTVGFCEDCCTGVDIVETTIPDGYVGVYYTTTLHLTGDAPFALGTIIAPDWMKPIGGGSITIVGDTVVIEGTPNVEGGIEFSLEVTNCSGSKSDTLAWSAIFDQPGDYRILLAAITDEDSQSVSLHITHGSSSGSAIIDWGDGNTTPFSFSVFGTVNKSHSYASPGTYPVTIFYTANTNIFTFTNISTTAKISLFSHTDNFTLFAASVQLSNVYNLSNCLPPAASHIVRVSYTGSTDAIDTSVDLSTLVASVAILSIQSFALLGTITNIPSTVNNSLAIGNCPVLGSINASGSLPAAVTQTFQDLLTSGVTFGTIDLSVCNAATFSRIGYSSSDVNNLLIALDANGITGGVVVCEQTTPAPPTGAGITAASNLTGKGWTVLTD